VSPWTEGPQARHAGWALPAGCILACGTITPFTGMCGSIPHHTSLPNALPGACGRESTAATPAQRRYRDVSGRPSALRQLRAGNILPPRRFLRAALAAQRSHRWNAMGYGERQTYASSVLYLLSLYAAAWRAAVTGALLPILPYYSVKPGGALITTCWRHGVWRWPLGRGVGSAVTDILPQTFAQLYFFSMVWRFCQAD